MLAASAGMHEANAAEANSPAAKTITKAKAQSRVRGTIPAGRAPIKSTRKRPLITQIMSPSEGHLAGLHRGDDPLDLRSSVALVVDQDTNEVLFEKNKNAVLPIASVTKLMTALVTVEADLPLSEELQVSQDELVQSGHPLQFAAWIRNYAWHCAASGFDVVGKSRCSVAGAHLPGRRVTFRRSYEREGAPARNERFAFC